MGDLTALLTDTYQLFTHDFTLYGFTFSFWQVFLFSAVSGIVGKILAEVVFGD